MRPTIKSIGGDSVGFRFSRRTFVSAISNTAAAFTLGSLLSPTRGSVLAQESPDRGRLLVRSARPEDLETPVELLDSWITPNDLFYVRSHLYTPEINIKDWSLRVEGEIDHPVTLRIDELKRLPEVSTIVTLECAGNGRAFFDPPVAGVQWEKGAVGTARWTGVRLADLLRRAGLKSRARYVVLDGADRPMGKVPDFVRNIPIAKAMHPDTLLAYEMNGAPIPVSHGFPLRAVVPGWEGAFAVKWLTHIRVLDQEHDGFFVKTGYRFPTKNVSPGAAVDPKDMAPLTGLIIKSIITAPADKAKIKTGTLHVKGFAWAGEANVIRVDVSVDNGSTWQPAQLGRNSAKYAWREFQYTWRPSRPGSYLIMSRAMDSQWRAQPVTARWNPSGYLWNVIDRIRIDVEA